MTITRRGERFDSQHRVRNRISSCGPWLGVLASTSVNIRHQPESDCALSMFKQHLLRHDSTSRNFVSMKWMNARTRAGTISPGGRTAHRLHTGSTV